MAPDQLQPPGDTGVPGQEPSEQEAALARIQPDKTINDEPDVRTAGGELYLENQRLEELLRGQRQDTDERKRYAYLFFCLSVGWIAIITSILLLQGFGSFWFG